MLFVMLLRECSPAEPHLLWDTLKESICNDLRRELERLGHRSPSPEDVLDYRLYLLDKELLKLGDGLGNYRPMPVSVKDWSGIERNRNQFILDQTVPYDPQEERHWQSRRWPPSMPINGQHRRPS